MNARNWKRLSLCALLCLGWFLRAEDLLVIRLGDKDSAASIAERHFGGAENSRELLAYNGLPEDAVLTPGAQLVVPMALRQAALRQLSDAERALAVAQDEMADQYAPAQYESTAKAYRAALEYRKSLDYARSTGMGRLCVLRSEEAVTAARQNASIRQSIALASIHGQVSVSDDGKQWTPATTNTVLNVGQILQSGDQGRAELSLPDGSRLRLMENTRMSIGEMMLDRRNGIRNSRLQLLQGAVQASVPKADPKASTFTLLTPNSELLLDNSDLFVEAAPGDLTRLSVFTGSAMIQSRERPLKMTAGTGTLIRGNRPPERDQALLSPPGLQGPDVLTTPVQEPLLAWSALDHRDLAAYQWELATDAAFLQPLTGQLISAASGTQTRTPVLPEGSYFWRVACISRDGIAGPWSPPRQLRVQKAMTVSLIPESKVWEHQKKAYVAGGNRFVIQAADAPSSVQSTEYSLNGGAFQKGQSFTLAQSGSYKIDVRGIAADGQAGPASTASFVADVDAPTVRVSRSEAPAADGVEWVDIQIDARDEAGVSRIQFRINDGPWLQYLNPFRISRAQPVRVDVQAIDIFGNRSALEHLDLTP